MPSKILLAQDNTESVTHILLKMLAFVLFHRERLQIEGDTHNDNIPFQPDLIQLDYQMSPRLWIECGECSVNKLDKLAVKVHGAEIWVIKRSLPAAQHLLAAMEKEELRHGYYHLLAFEEEMIDELQGLMTERNQFVWFSGQFDPPRMQFEFNGLWFDSSFTVLHF